MNELTKIRRVMGKVVPDGFPMMLLVLDGSTGPNAFGDKLQFAAATGVSALWRSPARWHGQGQCGHPVSLISLRSCEVYRAGRV